MLRSLSGLKFVNINFVHLQKKKNHFQHSETILHGLFITSIIALHLQSDHWCFGWQSSGMQSKDGKEVTLLGGKSLHIENNAIDGFQLIRVRDKLSDSLFDVNVH